MVSVTPIPSTNLHGYEKQAAIVVFIAFLIWWIIKLLANIFTGFMRRRVASQTIVQIENSNVEIVGAPAIGGMGGTGMGVGGTGVGGGMGVGSTVVASNNQNSLSGLRRDGYLNSTTGGYDSRYGHYHTRTQDAQSLAHSIFTSLGVTLLFVFLAQGGIPHVIHHIMWTALAVGELAVLTSLVLHSRLFGLPLILAFIGLLVSIWSLGVLRIN